MTPVSKSNPLPFKTSTYYHYLWFVEKYGTLIDT